MSRYYFLKPNGSYSGNDTSYDYDNAVQDWLAGSLYQRIHFQIIQRTSMKYNESELLENPHIGKFLLRDDFHMDTSGTVLISGYS